MRDLALCLVLASGCGEPLVAGDYGGRPKLVLRGKVDDAQPALVLPRGPVRAGLFWNPRGWEQVRSFTELREQRSNGWNLQYPGGFNWSLFEEPGPEHLATTPSGARYAFGVPLLYVDANANGRWEPDELLVADAPFTAVLFAPAPLSAADSPTRLALAAGYGVLLSQRFCAPEPPPPAEEECGVPLGMPCNIDADCGGGVCLVEDPFPWPGGYCAIPEPPPNGCRQKGAVLFRNPRSPAQAWWVMACQGPSGCRGGFPYQCEPTWNACLPSAHVLMQGSRSVRPRPVCLEDLPPGGGGGGPPAP